MTESKLMIDALVTQLYIIITRIVRTETSFQTEHTASIGYPNKHKVVDFITTYINENYMNEISLEMFAKDFKKYYDFPPSAIKHTLHANRIKQSKPPVNWWFDHPLEGGFTCRFPKREY